MPRTPDGEPPETDGKGVGPNDAFRSRKRRRVLACDTCRRIKSRCDFDRAEGVCNRCRNLRLSCSLTGPGNLPNGRKEKEADVPATELALIQELHARISEQSAMLRELKDMVQASQASSRPGTATSSRVSSNKTSLITRNGSEEIMSAVDRDNDSAPVVMIRNLNVTRRNVPPNAQSGRNRLTNHGLKELLDLGLFPRSVALELLDTFFARNGSWLQITSWQSMGVNPDLESMSSLLITSCILQGVRYSKYVNTEVHKVLYEHLRHILASVLLISPLPMEALYALAVASNWNMAPDKSVEFVDSWLLSGHCVQQAMLTINFTEIHANIKTGNSNTSTRVALRLWITFCLTHLYFAMGTGRPSIIAESYLHQCSSILNVVEASIEDGIMVAEISLYSTIIKLLATPLPIQADGKGNELEVWHEKWAHLLDVRIDRALIFRMSYHFGYLVLAQRSLKNLTTGHSNPENIFSTPSPPNSITINSDHRQYIILSIEHSTALLQTLMRLQPKTAEEVPDNILLSIIYAVIILATCYEDSPDPTANINTIREAIDFCKKARVVPMAAAEFAASKIQAKRMENGTQVESNRAEGIQEFENYGKETFLGWEFPTLEDLFGGSFLNGPFEDGYNFHLTPS